MIPGLRGRHILPHSLHPWHSYLHQLSVGSFGQIVRHQQVGGDEVEHLQTGEDHSEAVDEDDGLQGHEAQSSH